MSDLSVDVVIAGGSVAGIATAAALGQLGHSVLIVEPGQRLDRRLAGELIHPLGIAGLKELGLFSPEVFAGAAPIQGFAVFPEAGAASRIVLPYAGREAAAGQALAVDYAVLRQSLLAAVRGLDHVTMLEGARVTGLDLADAESPRVTVEVGGETRTYGCRLVVGADGPASRVRALAGIGHARRSLSTITGYVLEGVSLPEPGFGHVMIGGSSVVLAYAIGEGRVRIMFDQPVQDDGIDPLVHRHELLAALPGPFRDDVAAAIARQKPLTYRSAEVIAGAASRGPVVLVGDAGGSCHPLTATGMTVGIRDALRLRDALRDHRGCVLKASARYARRRRGNQRSRLMVAAALHEVCSRQNPENRLLRAGLIRYWQEPAHRSSTMAILAMTDDRIVSAFWHFLNVMRHGLVEHWAKAGSRSPQRLRRTARLVMSLAALTARQATLSARAR